jgi:hypothetical protein
LILSLAPITFTQIWDAEKGRSLRFSKVRLADVFAVNSDALL